MENVLMLSIVLRSSRASFIAGMAIGLFMMPRLLVTIISGIGGVFGMDEGTSGLIAMISPALIMNSLSGYAPKTEFVTGVCILVVYLVGMILLSIGIFSRQDELNYGE